MLHIEPASGNYRLVAKFKINEGIIVFNIQRNVKEPELEFPSEYYITTTDSNIEINHRYATPGTSSTINNNSVISTKFVKFPNPYYTVNKLLELIRADNKPRPIRIDSSLDKVKIAVDYVKREYEERNLRDLQLDRSDILYLDILLDIKTKKKYDNKLRLAFEYYKKFMRRNIKVFYPENLHEIPQNKKKYTTHIKRLK